LDYPFSEELLLLEVKIGCLLLWLIKPRLATKVEAEQVRGSKAAM
jgi:hypothetical protein